MGGIGVDDTAARLFGPLRVGTNSSPSRRAILRRRVVTLRPCPMHCAVAGIFAAYIFRSVHFFCDRISHPHTANTDLYLSVPLYCTCSCVQPYRERSIYCEVVYEGTTTCCWYVAQLAACMG